MSFYDELTEEYKADIDLETGLSESDRKALDLVIKEMKSGIRDSFRRGTTQVVLFYDNYVRNTPALVFHTVARISICDVLNGCLYDDRYAKAWKLLLDTLGDEFTVDVDHVSKGMYSDEFTIKITWKSPETEETTK